MEWYNFVMETEKDETKIFNANNFYFSHSVTQRPEAKDYYRHSHTRYELYVFFDGEADFILENHLFRMEPNNVILVPPLTYHYVDLKVSGKPYDRLIINFDTNLIFPELQAFLKSGVESFHFNAKKHLGILHDTENKFKDYHANDAALLVQLFVNRLFLDFKYTTGSDRGKKIINPTVTQILKYINEHIYEHLSLKKIAEALYLNPNYLSHIFPLYMKIGLMDYIKQKKINIAHELIRTENDTPTSAARKLGFEDYSTFYRLYKKYFRTIPSDMNEEEFSDRLTQNIKR